MTEQELKQHAAREHGGDMSKAERRQALTIPINFQVCPAMCASIFPPSLAARPCKARRSVTRVTWVAHELSFQRSMHRERVKLRGTRL